MHTRRVDVTKPLYFRVTAYDETAIETHTMLTETRLASVRKACQPNNCVSGLAANSRTRHNSKGGRIFRPVDGDSWPVVILFCPVSVNACVRVCMVCMGVCVCVISHVRPVDYRPACE